MFRHIHPDAFFRARHIAGRHVMQTRDLIGPAHVIACDIQCPAAEPRRRTGDFQQILSRFAPARFYSQRQRSLPHLPVHLQIPQQDQHQYQHASQHGMTDVAHQGSQCRRRRIMDKAIKIIVFRHQAQFGQGRSDGLPAPDVHVARLDYVRQHIRRHVARLVQQHLVRHTALGDSRQCQDITGDLLRISRGISPPLARRAQKGLYPLRVIPDLLLGGEQRIAVEVHTVILAVQHHRLITTGAQVGRFNRGISRDGIHPPLDQIIKIPGMRQDLDILEADALLH